MGQRECNTTIKGALYAKWDGRAARMCSLTAANTNICERESLMENEKREQQMLSAGSAEFLMRAPNFRQDLIINSTHIHTLYFV
jgi:hypothetical protein